MKRKIANGDSTNSSTENSTTEIISSLDHVGVDETTSSGFTTAITISVLVISLLIILIIAGVMFGMYKRIKRQINSPTPLGRNEIIDFFDGNKCTSEEAILPTIKATPYNFEYELDQDAYELEENVILESGNFGIVCKAKVKLGGDFEDVAAKMFKPKSKLIGLRSLLSEIKILSHLGKHENIACLVGANTKELKSGNVIVFTELCESSTLEKYLRRKQPGICSHVGDHYSGMVLDGEETICNLESVCKNSVHYKWSCEIAKGLEFITSKGVVHGDLATKNILLDIHLNAKITHFGISHEYSNYRRNENESLPWRWMPPESLKGKVFNEKTDVWAFGVTLWEIFCLGAVPFGGLVWSERFYSRLVDGMRLEKPERCPNDVYDIMTNCWRLDAKHRPTFKELLERIYERN